MDYEDLKKNPFFQGENFINFVKELFKTDNNTELDENYSLYFNYRLKQSILFNN